jgi:hypothetical protein
MRIIITENQKKLILNEIHLNDISDKIKSIVNKSTKTYNKLINNIDDIFGKTKTEIKSQFQFLFTWGAGIAGFIGPVEEFIRGQYPTLDEKEISLILIGVISTLFVEGNKRIKKEIEDKIEDYNLTDVYESVKEKSETLKNTFKLFIESVGGAISTMISMLSYTFILPLLTQFYDLAIKGVEMNITEFATRIISFTTLTITPKIIEKIIPRIINKFKKKID